MDQSYFGHNILPVADLSRKSDLYDDDDDAAAAAFERSVPQVVEEAHTTFRIFVLALCHGLSLPSHE